MGDLLDQVDLAESERTSKAGEIDKMQGRIRARHDQAHKHKQERQALADEYGPEKEKEKEYKEKEEKMLARQKQEEEDQEIAFNLEDTVLE